MYKQNRKTMKNLLTLTFIFTLFLGFHSIQADVIIVNNNEGQPGDYVDLQDAIDAADPNDIIYVVGSDEYYHSTSENVMINKPLTIIGPGYFLGQNNEINTQASNITAKVHLLYIGDGADGTIITGMDIDFHNNASLRIGNIKRDRRTRGEAPKNITIIRNKLNHVRVEQANGTIIKENYISYSGNPVYLYQEASNTFIAYNIILGGTNHATIYGPNNVGMKGTIIKNNTLSNGLYRIHSVDDIYNNIFIKGGLNDCNNNVLKNNIFTASEEGFLTGTSVGNTTYKNLNNEFGEAAATLFIEAEPALDKDYKLADSSPAKGAGIVGEDAGAFTTGSNAYKVSGLPAVPAIYELTTPGVGTAADGMKVTIKAKSHN